MTNDFMYKEFFFGKFHVFEFNRLTFKYFDKPNLFNLSDLP